METLAAKIKNSLFKAKKQLELKLKQLFVEQNRRFVMALVIAFAVVIAGINIAKKLSSDEVTVKAQDNSILVSLLYGEGDIETVTNETPVLEEKRLSPITVASAAPIAGIDFTEDEKDALPSSVVDSNLTTLRKDTLVKNNTIETKVSIKPREKPIIYTVKGGDTVSSIARKFDIDEATVLQENKKYADDLIKTGDELTILPVSGTTERVDEGETLAAIAKKHEADIDEIIAFNNLESADDIEYAQILVIPGGKREAKNKPKPVIKPTVLAAANPRTASTSSGSTSTASNRSSSVSTPVVKTGGQVANRFPWGWCTWYVAQKRGDVNWRGNAGTWLNGARSAGRATGKVPAVGAIMVTSESGYGHVAYVEAVNGNQVTVSEMNYRGFGVVSSRTISSGNRVIKGYIY